jgi:hypothetical protein
MRLIAAGAENGSAVGEDAGQLVAANPKGTILDQTSETVAKPDDGHLKLIHRSLAKAANRRIETWTITATRQDADVLLQDLSPSVTNSFPSAACPRTWLRTF